MRGFSVLIKSAALVALAVFALGSGGCESSGNTTAVQGTQTASLPKLDVTDWVNIDGQAPMLTDLKGKPVVLEFWATWCPPCLQLIPHMKDLHEKHADDGLTILSIHDANGARKKALERFAKDQKITYPIGLDTTGRVMSAYGIRMLPHAVVIDREGKVIWDGYPGEDAFDKAVQKALGTTS
jgi:thiol-disulfide isomerase/thioredoxin